MIPDNLNETLVWRAISWKRHYGHWEILLDDYMLCPRIGDYILEAQSQGAEKISLHLLGPYKNVQGMVARPMRGADSIARQRKNHTIEEFA